MSGAQLMMQGRQPAAGGSFNPLTERSWHTAYWASDADWTPPADGAAVSSWRDGSGNGRTAVQATGSKQPTFRASVATLNNRPGVEFDGSADTISAPAFTAVPQPYTLVIVARVITLSPDAYLAGVNTSGASGGPLVRSSGGYKWAYYFGSLAVGAVPADTNPHIFEMVVNGASSELRVDGTVVVSGNSGAVQANTLHVASYQGVSALANAVHGFVGFETGAQSAATLATLRAGLKSFYGIP